MSKHVVTLGCIKHFCDISSGRYMHRAVFFLTAYNNHPKYKLLMKYATNKDICCSLTTNIYFYVNLYDISSDHTSKIIEI
jgi:hypothetical protein